MAITMAVEAYTSIRSSVRCLGLRIWSTAWTRRLPWLVFCGMACGMNRLCLSCDWDNLLIYLLVCIGVWVVVGSWFWRYWWPWSMLEHSCFGRVFGRASSCRSSGWNFPWRSICIWFMKAIGRWMWRFCGLGCSSIGQTMWNLLLYLWCLFLVDWRGLDLDHSDLD